MQSFTVYGRLPGENEFISANRSDVRAGNEFKQRWQKYAWAYILRAELEPIVEPIVISYHFYEPDRRRDCGNIFAFAQKVIEDALQDAGILRNDSQKWVRGYKDIKYDVDKNNPRIEVTLWEERNE